MGLPKTIFRLVILVLGLACASIAAAQPVSIATDSALHEEPKADSRVITQLKAGATAEMIGRQAAWVNLKTPSGTGWVLSFNVRFGSGGGQAGSAGAGLGSLFTRSKPATTATIGIRGLEAEDVNNATFSQPQLNLLDKYAVSKSAAESAARANGLEAVRVDYFTAQ